MNNKKRKHQLFATRTSDSHDSGLVRTTPRPTGKDTLDVLEGEVAQPSGLQSSSRVLAKASGLVWVRPPSVARSAH
jgi:hypothetical protein